MVRAGYDRGVGRARQVPSSAGGLMLIAAAAATRRLVVAPSDRWRCVAMGACMAGYQAAYFTAVTLGGIVTVALIAICSAPLVIAALAPWWLGERLTTRART